MSRTGYRWEDVQRTFFVDGRRMQLTRYGAYADVKGQEDSAWRRNRHRSMRGANRN